MYLYLLFFILQVTMYFLRTLILVCLIAGTFGFGYNRWQTGSGRAKLCINNCKTNVKVIIGPFKLPSNPGCSWSRTRAIGISGWASKSSARRQWQEFCASCPDPAACLPQPEMCTQVVKKYPAQMNGLALGILNQRNFSASYDVNT